MTKYLEEIGEIDNTLVMFISDNGAEGAAYEAYPVSTLLLATRDSLLTQSQMVKEELMTHIAKYYDNSYDNIGNGNSFVWYGPRWAQAATAPSRLYKAYTTEGGVRVPAVLRYPGFRPAEIKHTFATVMDIAPTLLEMAGVKHPAPDYKGRKVVSMRGESMVPWLKVRYASRLPSSGKFLHSLGYRRLCPPPGQIPRLGTLWSCCNSTGELESRFHPLPQGAISRGMATLQPRHRPRRDRRSRTAIPGETQGTPWPLGAIR